MTVHILALDATQNSVNRQIAYVGFTAQGEETRFFEAEAFDALDLSRGDIVIGGVGFAQRAMARLGLAAPALPSIPEPLAPFAGRKLWRATMGDARARIDRGERLFVKPIPERTKRFDGRALLSFQDLIATARVPDEEPVECAEIVDFVSESRAFILRGAVLDLRPYKGDPLRFPDPAILRAALTAYAPAPRAYALDLGVTAEGRTLIVEINDAYATGAYGLAPMRYASFIAARWRELEEAARAA
ncbi:MAG: ATP-grasp domain-containing protein [Pseudomonadota bacterium]